MLDKSKIKLSLLTIAVGTILLFDIGTIISNLHCPYPRRIWSTRYIYLFKNAYFLIYIHSFVIMAK